MIKFDVLESAVSADRLENGAWLHLLSPINEEPLYADAKKERPCRALIRSYRSQVYRSKDFQIQQKAMGKARRAKRRDLDKALEADMQLERPQKFAALLIGLENCSTDARGMQTPSEDDKIQMAQDTEYQWLVDQVMEFAFTDENYGPAAVAEAKADEGNGAGAAAEETSRAVQP